MVVVDGRGECKGSRQRLQKDRTRRVQINKSPPFPSDGGGLLSLFTPARIGKEKDLGE